MGRFKRFVGVVIVMLLLTGCAGGGGVPKPKETLMKPYSNQYYGIMYPTEFIYDVGGDGYGGEIFVSLLRDEPSFSVRVLRMKPLGRFLTAEDFEALVDIVIGGIQDNIHATIVSNSRFNLKGDQPAHKVVYTEYVYGEETEKKMQIATCHKDVILVMYFSSKINKFDSRLPIFNEIIDSFEFLF